MDSDRILSDISRSVLGHHLLAHCNRYGDIVRRMENCEDHGAKSDQAETGRWIQIGYLATFHVPFWVIICSHIAIATGTLFGGWRIVKTMGQKVTKLKPADGFRSDT